MDFSKTVLRHVYIDINNEEGELSEIYLYQVDYKSNRTFRTSEFTYNQPLPVVSVDDEGNEITIPAEEVDLKEEFFNKIVEYRTSGIPVKFFAIDANEIMVSLIDPLMQSNLRAKKLFNTLSNEAMPYEWLTCVISMARVIPTTDFDERPELSSNFRMRIKAKFHAVANEIRREKKNHIFVSYEQNTQGTDMSFTITDEEVNILEDIHIHGKSEEDILVSKACSIINKYPDADILLNKTSIRLYKLFCKTNMFVNEKANSFIYSMNSMLYALGKKGIEASAKVYNEYIRNAENLRFGRYRDESLYSVYSIRLPFSYNSEGSWARNFKGNTLWSPVSIDKSEYILMGANKKKSSNNSFEEMYGKLSVEKDRERFLLKVDSISVKKYVPGYAVLTVEVENRFYPGKKDMERIEELISSMFSSKVYGDEYPDLLNLQLRVGEKTYSMQAGTRSDEEHTPWLGLILSMGRKRPNAGRGKLVMATLSDSMFVTMDDGGIKRAENLNEDAVCKCLVKSEYLLQLESYLAEVIEPKHGRSFGALTKGQRRNVKRIAGAFAYMEGSYSFLTEMGEYQSVYKYVNKVRHIKETEERLERKLNLLYE